jgi:diguanylate cyclase (GGDEF)-like protein
MALSLPRISNVGAALLALGVVAVVVTAFLFYASISVHSIRLDADTAARLLADRIASQIAQYQAIAQRLAEQAAARDLLNDKRGAERASFVDAATLGVPQVLKVRLLRAGTEETDNQVPELTYVCLDLLNRSARGEKAAAAEFHLPGTPSAHIDVFAPIKDPADAQRVLGHVLLTLDPASWRSAFTSLRPEDGYVEWRQAAPQTETLVVAGGGDAGLKSGEPLARAEVAGTDWKIAVWPPAPVTSLSLSEAAAIGGAALLAVVLLGLSHTQPQRTLAKAIRHDSEVLVTLFNDIRAGVLMGQYPFRLAEFKQLATQVRQSGEAMIEDRRNLERRTQIDALTGLGARTAFDSRLEQLRQQAHTGFTSALLLADIDNLEEINVQIGPEAGDILLKQFARQLRAALRQSDYVARLDDGRFGVLFPMTDLEKIEPVVHRLRQRLSEEFDPGSGLPRAYSWSAGLTLIATRDAQSQDALARAENALQTARRDGGNRTVTQMPPA